MSHGLAETFWRRAKRKQKLLFLLAGATALLAIVAVSFGTYPIKLIHVVQSLLRTVDDTRAVVVWNVRLPRIAASLSVGAGLALAGLFIQTLLRNPLGSPSTLGISQGAAFGASCVIILFQAGPFWTATAAFAGSLGATVLIVVLGRLRGLTPEAVILAGVAFSSLFGAATVLLQVLSDETRLARAVAWSFGDVGRSNWTQVGWLSLSVMCLWAVGFLWRWHLNALDMGEEPAKNLGISVETLRWQGLILAALVSALATAFHGVIAFVGLIAPHAARRIVGADHRFLVPMTAVLGSALLLLADTLSRTMLGTGSFPVGVVTSFLGAPLFLTLLLKRRA
ncbi:MAG: iron ABC transporter permease [Desulfosoma sp.]